MRTHGECAQARAVRQGHGDGRGLAASLRLRVDEVAYGTEVGGIFGECGDDGRFQCHGAVRIKEI